MCVSQCTTEAITSSNRIVHSSMKPLVILFTLGTMLWRCHSVVEEEIFSPFKPAMAGNYPIFILKNLLPATTFGAKYFINRESASFR